MPFLAVWHKVPELRYTEAYTEPSPRTPASALRHGISASDQLDPTHAVSTLDADMEGAIFLRGRRLPALACLLHLLLAAFCFTSGHGYLRVFPTRPN